MADPADTDGEDDQDQAPKKNWRKELEGRAETAEQALVDASQELAFYKAGLGDLTDEQRTDVLTLAKAKGQTSADDLKAIADRLSYTPTPAAPAPTETATQAEDPDRQAELAQLRGFASGSRGPETPAPPGTVDLSDPKFNDNDALKEYLMGIVDDGFGPTFE
jgi:hypothetical protein